MKIYLILILLCLLSSAALAQHCPYDGTSLIVVHLTNEEGEPVKNAALTLQEIENPNAENCSYAQGLQSRPFLSILTSLDDVLNRENTTEDYCKDCTFFGGGFYAVRFNQAQTSCMIKNGNDFEYKARKYEIVFGVEKIAVQKEQIYSLCSGNGKWSRIAPIEFKVKSEPVK